MPAPTLPEGITARDLFGLDSRSWDSSVAASNPKIQQLIDAGIIRVNQSGEGGNSWLSLDPDVNMTPRGDHGEHVRSLRAVGDDGKVGDGYSIKNQAGVRKDSTFGNVTDAANVYDSDGEPLWTKLAPIAVSLLAPMAGAALSAAGIGGAAIGGTAGVTGGIAGLEAANIASGGPSSLLGTIAKKAPSLARQYGESGTIDPSTLIGLGAQGLGVDPRLITAGMTLGGLARQRKG